MKYIVINDYLIDLHEVIFMHFGKENNTLLIRFKGENQPDVFINDVEDDIFIQMYNLLKEKEGE